MRFLKKMFYPLAIIVFLVLLVYGILSGDLGFIQLESATL